MIRESNVVGYIYVITNVINNKKYIGKTTLNIEKRFKQHCNEYKKERCKNRPLYSAMLKYGVENFTIDLLHTCKVEDLSKYEQYYINQLSTYGNNGYNATKGGDGSILYNYDEILKLYITGLTMRDIAYKLSCCVDTVSKVINNSKIKKHKNKLTGFCLQPIKVYQCDKDTNEVLQQFMSINDAVKWLYDSNILINNKPSNRSGICGSISNCCKGKSKTAYGYKWKYVEKI